MSVTGASDIVSHLRELGNEASATLEPAAMRGAEIIRADAASRAPRLTGKLAGEIKAEVKSANNDRVIVKIGPSTDAFYGKFHELGTSKMPAQPFLAPALAGKKTAAKNAAVNALKEALGL
jgi:HK97 gp10 family phage protein